MLGFAVALMISAIASGETRVQPATIETAAHTPDPVKLKAAHELADAMFPAATRDIYFDGVISGTLRNLAAGFLQNESAQSAMRKNPKVREVFDAFLERQRQLGLDDLRGHMPELLNAYANAYARRFSTDELHQLTRFFSEPLGRKYFTMTPTLVADVDIAAWQQGVASRAMQRRDTEVQRLKDDLAAATNQKTQP